MFDVNVEARDNDPAKPISPWKHLSLDPGYSGRWMVAGDVDGDGIKEFITARNKNQEVTTILATRLDGSTAWTWGNRNAGEPGLTYDVPLQVHDIDGDGGMEVVFSTRGSIVILDGENGKEKERHPLPPGLDVSDCITFADFRGRGTPGDIIVKSRYKKIWAFSGEWDELWTWPPGDSVLSPLLSTCHHPEPFDLDGDGKDEILAGNIMLDHEGSELWHIESDHMSLLGHLDAMRVAKLSRDLAKTRLVVTYCSGNTVGIIDGNGKVVWERHGAHYESPDVGIVNEAGEIGIFVDVDHLPLGESRAELFSMDGALLGTYRMNYGRQHRMVDWTGDGIQEIVLGNARTVVDTRGKIVARLEIPMEDASHVLGEHEPGAVSILDITGKGRGDIVLHSNHEIFIYENPHPAVHPAPPHRDEFNFTFY